MKDYAYYNGTLTPYDSACIPLSDRSVFFADAVYDVMIGYQNNVYQFDKHFERLQRNAERIGLHDIPSSDEIKRSIDAILKASGADTFLLYIQLSASNSRRNHSREKGQTNILLTITEYTPPNMLKCVKAITYPDIRYLMCDIKTTNLLPNVLSIEYAESEGVDMAIFHKNGTVTECANSNISILNGNTLTMHPHDFSVLPGISEANLTYAAANFGLECERRNFSISELYSADTVFITSTTKLLRVCSHIDKETLRIKNLHIAEMLFDALKADFTAKTGTFS